MGDADRSLESLRQAILQALMDSGQLTPEMLQLLRDESTGDPARDQEIRRQLGELLDRIVQRLIDEGYHNIGQAHYAAQQVQFNSTPSCSPRDRSLVEFVKQVAAMCKGKAYFTTR
jgi:hypothetical protein